MLVTCFGYHQIQNTCGLNSYKESYKHIVTSKSQITTNGNKYMGQR